MNVIVWVIKHMIDCCSETVNLLWHLARKALDDKGLDV